VPLAGLFSSVLGDLFHAMDRAKVGIHHPFKKGYYVALRDAVFAWDPLELEALKHKMRVREGFPWADLSGVAREKQAAAVESAITKRMYFDSKYFKDRVRRRVLPADHLYARVRAVYAYYGRQEDPETNKPLFNEVGEPYLLLCSSIAPGLVLFICRAVRVRVAALFVCFCPVLMHYSGDVVRLWVSVSIYLHPSRQRGRKQRTC
jgi:hypothetical protein